MCAEVLRLFLHKKQVDSVINLQRFKLLGHGSVSNVAHRMRLKKEELPAIFSKRVIFLKTTLFFQWYYKWS